MSFYNASATAASNTTINSISAAGSASANLIDDLVRQLAAQDRQFANDLGGNNTVGGTADAITITPSSGSITAAFDGLVIGFVAGSDNTSGSVTANVGGLGAEPVKKALDGAETALAVGDIQAGGYYLLRWRASWDSSGGAWEWVNITGQSRDVGQVAAFAMNSAPAGWLECDGAAVSRATYSTLFARIGTTFGTGDGSTTFNVPDLRAEFVRGWDNSRGVDTGRVFGSAQTDALKTHTHTLTAGRYYGNGTSGNTGWSADPAYISNLGLATGNPSTGTSNETRPRNVALLYCIRY